MGLLDRFNRKRSETPPIKKKLASLKCRRISYVDCDFAQLEHDMREDCRAILTLVPVNYYAVKNQYIMAHVYTSADYEENYVQLTRVDFEKVTNKSEVYSLDFDTLSKALAKVGIIITKPAAENTD